MDDPQIGTTRFCTCDLPEPERIVLEYARKIGSAEIPFEDTTTEQREILERAHKLLKFRIFDLFTSYMEGLLCRGDKIARITLHERFLWFIQQLALEMQQHLEVSELEKNAPEDSEVDIVDEYYRRAPEVFTPESYDKLTSEITFELIKKGKLKVLK